MYLDNSILVSLDCKKKITHLNFKMTPYLKEITDWGVVLYWVQRFKNDTHLLYTYTLSYRWGGTLLIYIYYLCWSFLSEDDNVNGVDMQIKKNVYLYSVWTFPFKNAKFYSSTASVILFRKIHYVKTFSFYENVVLLTKRPTQAEA